MPITAHSLSCKFIVRKILLGATGATLLLGSPQLAAQASTFEGSASGQFGLPLTPGFGSDVFLSNEAGSNNQLNWGTPATGSFNNFVRFAGGPFSTSVDTTFQVGTLTYRNGATNAGSGFDGDFPLTVTLNFTTPTGVNQSFEYLFNILNTPNNTGDPVVDGDRLLFSSNGLSSSTFNVGGVDYTLQLLGFSNDLGNTILSQFNSPEESTAIAGLYGRITAAPIPTPALLPGLIGMGIAAIRKRKAAAAESANEA